jgi:hypothetical protein
METSPVVLSSRDAARRARVVAAVKVSFGVSFFDTAEMRVLLLQASRGVKFFDWCVSNA